MRLTLSLILLAALAALAPARTIIVRSDLQAAIDQAQYGDTLRIGAGRFEANSQPYIEKTCGNCQDQRTSASATRGFEIRGKRVFLLGPSTLETILVTRAGYGLLCDSADGTVLQNLIITGGKRDPDGRATDAGIVIKNGHVTVRNCEIRDNSDFIDSTIVGIGGIMIREGGRATLENCRIIHNSWDGIALYRGAEADIRNCVIHSGRGVGIGVTWDAVATCEENSISHYWKGIGSFGTATVVARDNLVHDNLGWGIIAAGTSTMIAENNTVVRNGNCGLAIWEKGTRGRFVNNISAFNGWRKQWVCPCVGFWNQEGDTCGWEISHNLVWQNDSANVAGADSGKFMITDPMFSDTLEYKLSEKSPARGTGDPVISTPDGRPSDVGASGTINRGIGWMVIPKGGF